MMERAGGKAVTGTGENILDRVPTSVHQRCPIILEAHSQVDKFEKCASRGSEESRGEEKNLLPLKATDKGAKFPLT